MTWFNPPYLTSVKTTVGRDFSKLLNTAFPANNPLHKLFNYSDKQRKLAKGEAKNGSLSF
jgi:hypothetical protein